MYLSANEAWELRVGDQVRLNNSYFRNPAIRRLPFRFTPDKEYEIVGKERMYCGMIIHLINDLGEEAEINHGWLRK